MAFSLVSKNYITVVWMVFPFKIFEAPE